jgi:esterase
MLHYKSLGHGPHILILHGLFGSSDNWQTIAKKLSERNHVILIDLINHGLSPWRDHMTYPDMAEDVQEIIQKLTLKNVTLLGHSMGGKVAIQLAHDYPENIQKLIIADIAPKKYSPHHSDVLNALEHNDPDLIPDSRTRQFIQKSFKKTESGRAWQFNAQALVKNYSNIMEPPRLTHPIETPSLFIQGETSDYIQPSDLKDIPHYFPNNSHIVIPRAGHWLHAENPTDFLRAISPE